LTAEERALVAPAAQLIPAESMTVALRDARVWRCSITWLFVMTGSYALLYWLPQMVRQMNIGGNEFRIGAFSALPQVGLVIGMLLNAWLSDRSGERRWHVGIPAVLGGIAMLAGGLMPPGWAALVLLIVAGAGIGAAQAVFWAVPASMGIGNGRISVATVSLISIFGTAGGIIGPTLIGVVKDATGSFLPSLVLLSLLLAAGGLVIAPLTKIRTRP
jgi:ACS family tartrate transporter-like MFS transporter